MRLRLGGAFLSLILSYLIFFFLYVTTVQLPVNPDLLSVFFLSLKYQSVGNMVTSTIYYGAVINPQTLTFYQALPNCLLAVGHTGEIDWIVEDVVDSMVQETMAQKGCLDADVIALKHGEFIMPGFIDTHTVRI